LKLGWHRRGARAALRLESGEDDDTIEAGDDEAREMWSGWCVRDRNKSVVGENKVRQTTTKPCQTKVNFGTHGK
jgi:hypothetical protein